MSTRPASIGFIARVALITSLTALSLDSMLPALPYIGDSLQVENPNNLQLVVSLFIFGMFFGELIFGPLSDAMGRKRALAIGVAIYCFGSLMAICSTSLELLLFGRIVQGIGASGPKIISRAMIRDNFSGARMARVFSFIMTVFICIPMIAPAMGQLIAEMANWRAIFIVLFVIAVGTTIWIQISQPETLPVSKRVNISMARLCKTTLLIVRHRVACCYGVTAGFIFGIFLLYLSTAQAMFEKMYDKGDSFPLYFAILASGFGSAALMNSKLVMKYGMRRLCYFALGGLAFLGFFFLFTGENGVPSFTLFMVGCYILLFSVGVLFSNLTALAMQPLGAVAGLGASVVSAISSIMAVIISIFAGRFFDNNVNVMVYTIFICTALSLTLFFIVERKTVEPVKGYTE